MIQLSPSQSKAKYIKTTTFESVPSSTLLNHYLSTSPHSEDSPQTSNKFPIPQLNTGTLSYNEEQEEDCSIEINIYNRTYQLKVDKYQECLSKLKEIMDDAEVSEETKISIKLIVSKKLLEISMKYQKLYDATAKEYEKCKTFSI